MKFTQVQQDQTDPYLKYAQQVPTRKLWRKRIVMICGNNKCGFVKFNLIERTITFLTLGHFRNLLLMLNKQAKDIYKAKDFKVLSQEEVSNLPQTPNVPDVPDIVNINPKISPKDVSDMGNALLWGASKLTVPKSSEKLPQFISDNYDNNQCEVVLRYKLLKGEIAGYSFKNRAIYQKSEELPAQASWDLITKEKLLETSQAMEALPRITAQELSQFGKAPNEIDAILHFIDRNRWEHCLGRVPLKPYTLSILEQTDQPMIDLLTQKKVISSAAWDGDYWQISFT